MSMIVELQITWSANQLAEACRKGIVSLENARQRGLCWKLEQKSLLIHSIVAGFPIPRFYVIKDGGQYDIIDGKQRTDAITSYMGGEYVLSKDLPLIEMDGGDSYQLGGLKFHELHADVQDIIRNRRLDFIHVDNITEDEIDNLFFRLNNGTSMSPIVMTCAKTKSIEQINLASSHAIFEAALTKSKLEAYAHKDITVKSWLSLNMYDPAYSAAAIREIMSEVDIAEDSILVLWECLDRMLDVYQYINDSGAEAKAMCMSNISKPTHFVALMPVIKRSLDDGISLEDFANWVMRFFPGTKIASVDEAYNVAARSSKKENIRIRNEVINRHYAEHFSDKGGE